MHPRQWRQFLWWGAAVLLWLYCRYTGVWWLWLHLPQCYKLLHFLTTLLMPPFSPTKCIFCFFSELSFDFYTCFWMMADEIIYKKAYREWHYPQVNFPSVGCLIWSFYWPLCVLMGHSWQISKIPLNVIFSVGCRGVGFLPLLPYLIPQTFLDNHSVNSSLKTLLLLMTQLNHSNFLKSQDWYFCWMWVGE